MFVPRTAAELYRHRRGRNIALAVMLAVLVVMFFSFTILKMQNTEQDHHAGDSQSPRPAGGQK